MTQVTKNTYMPRFEIVAHSALPPKEGERRLGVVRMGPLVTHHECATKSKPGRNHDTNRIDTNPDERVRIKPANAKQKKKTKGVFGNTMFDGYPKKKRLSMALPAVKVVVISDEESDYSEAVRWHKNDGMLFSDLCKTWGN